MRSYRPAWGSENAEIALNDIDIALINDQFELTRVAQEARRWEAGYVAAKVLVDQPTLADVAKHGKHAIVRLIAVEKLTDQNVLTDIAINDEYPAIRVAVADRLTDQRLAQEVYADVAKLVYHKFWNNIGIYAVKKLTNRILLADVAKNGKYDEIRKVACEKIGHIYGEKSICKRCGTQKAVKWEKSKVKLKKN